MDSTDFDYNLYILGTDDTTRQIPVELPDADSHLRGVAFDSQGNLYAYASGCKYIYKIDISEGTAEKLTEISDSIWRMQCGGNTLMCVTSEKVFLYDLEKQDLREQNFRGSNSMAE